MSDPSRTVGAAADVVLSTRPAPHVAVLTINRPRARNAVNVAVAQALSAHVQAIEADPEVRVAILTGAGQQAFCAGADLKEVAGDVQPGGRTHGSHGFAGFVFAPRRKAWIAAVNGAAVAGGLELMLACDFAISSGQALFGLPEVKRGLAAVGGGVFRLPRAIPRGLALELIATGDSIDAARALQLGLVNQLVAPDQVLSTALDIAVRISRNAPLAVRLSLGVARDAQDTDEATLRARMAAVSDQVLASADAMEGPRAFAEHREPRWHGA